MVTKKKIKKTTKKAKALKALDGFVKKSAIIPVVNFTIEIALHPDGKVENKLYGDMEPSKAKELVDNIMHEFVSHQRKVL